MKSGVAIGPIFSLTDNKRYKKGITNMNSVSTDMICYLPRLHPR